MSWAHIFTTHEFWAGFPAGALISGIVAPIITARRSRNSDQFKATHDEKMHTLKTEQEDLRSKREILRETATKFSEVCSSVLEKALDSKGVFNSVLDAAQNMQGKIDKKALEKVQLPLI
jgi:hypothetical protein